MALVEVQSVRKSYDGRAVVDGVSFAVDEGEIFGILGPNGAGKTTLVECIEGLRRHDEGRIRVLGLDPHRDGIRLRRVLGAQLQSSALQERLEVGEALELYGSFYDDPIRAGDLLELLGLSGQRAARYGTLSGGQKQRLSIALALVGRPRVAVLDELTTGLDPQARRDTWSLIEGVRDLGVTVLLVTHFMDEAERLCDRVAIIDQGRIVGLDRPAGLVSTIAGEQRLRFTVSEPLDHRLLGDLDEVLDVSQEGERLVVAGTGNVVQAVMVTLAGVGVVPVALQVEQQRLEEVFVALTGRPSAAIEAVEVLAQLTIATIGVAMAIVAALTLLEVPAPASWPGVLVSLLLAAAAIFAIGLLLGAVVPSTSAAQAASAIVWIPVMVLAGLWFPREGMPPTMRRISDLSPGGAGVDAVQQTWFGSGVPWSSLGVLVAFAVAVGGAAALAFRWD